MQLSPMNSDRSQMRRRSMQGTVLFILGIAAVIWFVVNGSVWLVGLAAVLLVPGLAMLGRVGKSLR